MVNQTQEAFPLDKGPGCSWTAIKARQRRVYTVIQTSFTRERKTCMARAVSC